MWLVAIYGCEMRAVTKDCQHMLRMIERKILLKLYGPTDENDKSRSCYNQEQFNELINKKGEHCKICKISKFTMVG